MAGGKDRGYSNETHNILKENGKVFWFRSSWKIYKVGSLVSNLFFITNKEIRSNSLSILASAIHYGWNDNVINIRLTDKRVSFSSTLGMANIL